MEKHRTSLSAQVAFSLDWSHQAANFQTIQLYIQSLKFKHLQILKINRFLYYNKQIFLHEMN